MIAADITDEQMTAACEHITAGGALKSAAEMLGVSVSSLWRALSSRGAEMYTRAREARATSDEAKIESVCDAVEQGALAPEAARVILSGRQWLAERRDGRRYGTKVSQEISGPGGGPVVHQFDAARLSDGELASMEAVLEKSVVTSSSGDNP